MIAVWHWLFAIGVLVGLGGGAVLALVMLWRWLTNKDVGPGWE